MSSVTDPSSPTSAPANVSSGRRLLVPDTNANPPATLTCGNRPAGSAFPGTIRASLIAAPSSCVTRRNRARRQPNPTAAAATAPTASVLAADPAPHLGVRRRRERHQLVARHVAGRAAPAPGRARRACGAWNTGEATLSRISTKLLQRHLGDGLGVARAGAARTAAAPAPSRRRSRRGSGRARRRPRTRSSRPGRRTARSRARRRRAAPTRPSACHGAQRHGAEHADRVVLVVVDEVRGERRRGRGSRRAKCRSIAAGLVERGEALAPRRSARTACR